MIPYIESHRVMYLSRLVSPFLEGRKCSLYNCSWLVVCLPVGLCIWCLYSAVYSVCMVFCGYGKERRMEGWKGRKGMVEEFVCCMEYHSFLFLGVWG